MYNSVIFRVSPDSPLAPPPSPPFSSPRIPHPSKPVFISRGGAILPPPRLVRSPGGATESVEGEERRVKQFRPLSIQGPTRSAAATTTGFLLPRGWCCIRPRLILACSTKPLHVTDAMRYPPRLTTEVERRRFTSLSREFEELNCVKLRERGVEIR